MTYHLDTNTLIYFFKGQGKVSQNLLNHSPQHLAIPSIVLMELEVGIVKSTRPQKRMKQLAELISFLKVIPFSEKEAQASAGLRAQLEKKGSTIGPYDLLIAGTALAHQATLVTRNKREFRRVSSLKLEDWFV